jgi:hypothetical protein
VDHDGTVTGRGVLIVALRLKMSQYSGLQVVQTLVLVTRAEIRVRALEIPILIQVTHATVHPAIVVRIVMLILMSAAKTRTTATPKRPAQIP